MKALNTNTTWLKNVLVSTCDWVAFYCKLDGKTCKLLFVVYTSYNSCWSHLFVGVVEVVIYL